MNILLMIEILLRWISILCIFSGMIYLSHNKFKIILEFSPIFVFSFITVFVFLCGLCGFLQPSVYIVCGIGGLSFLYMLKNINERIKLLEIDDLQDISIIHIIFLIGAFCFLIQLLQTSFVHYDNYSHWAVVVKEMLITKAFPSADNVMVEFKNYPLGMSSFIYFICEIIGHEQPNMLFAQGIITFSCFYALFGIITERKRFLLYVFLATGCSILSIFNISIRINNLLVDFILPILALAILAIIYRYRAQPHKIYVVTCPIFGLLVVVKNTGIIYAVFTIAYLIYVLVKYRDPCTNPETSEVDIGPNYKKTNKILLSFKTVCFLFASMLTTIAWNIHMKYTFAGVNNKFEISTDKMQGIYGEKTPEDVKNIVLLFFNSIIDISSRPTIGILLFEVLAIVFCVVGVLILKKKWMLPKVLISLNIILVLYYLGILGMYIFSMPLYEALYLAGFERYACSIVIFFGGALTMCATIDIESSFYYRIGKKVNYRSFKSLQHKEVYNISIIICISLLLLILSSEFNGLSYHIKTYKDTLPAKVNTVVGDNWDKELDDTRYLVYASDMDSQVTNYYLQYITKYYLRNNHVDGICYFYEDNMLNLLSQYDKLIIIEPDKEQQALMQKYLNVSGDAGVYSLHD